MVQACQEDPVDTVRPAITNLVVWPEDGRARRGETVTVRFEVTDDVALGAVSATLADWPMTCTSEDADEFRCTGRSPASAGQREFTARIHVRAADAAGNENEAFGFIDLDLLDPRVEQASVRYVADSELSRLIEPTKAGSDTEIRVRLSFSEPVASEVLTLVAHNESERLSFERIDGGRGFVREVEFSALGGSVRSEGIFVPRLTLRDRVGNEVQAATFRDPEIAIDLTADTLLVAQDQVSFIRSVVGNTRPEELVDADGEVAHTLPPTMEYFELGPADGLDPVSTLPPDTFRFEDGSAPVSIRVWDVPSEPSVDPARATIMPDDRGRWPRTLVEPPWPNTRWLNSRDLFVTGVDQAGNESRTVRIETEWWVASTAAALDEDGSHPVVTAPEGDVESSFVREVDDRGPVEAPDGRAVTRSTETELTWVRRELSGDAPGARWQHVMVYDRARARSVLIGGRGASQEDPRTWELDGDRWIPIETDVDVPLLRFLHAGAYDAGREETVIFGGRYEDIDLGDTWTWDGRAWSDRTPIDGPTPSPRHGHAMAHDAARNQVVLYGGMSSAGELADTWVWDGASWSEVSPRSSAPSPGPRSEHTMVYDPESEQILLFGGAGRSSWAGSQTENALWAWDGQAWREVAPASTEDAPVGRFGHAMVFDAQRRQVLLFGGDYLWLYQGSARVRSPLRDTWTWDGATWTRFEPSSFPDERSGAALVYDHAARRPFSYGGYTRDLQCGSSGGSWFPDDTTCTDVSDAHDDAWAWVERTHHPAARLSFDSPLSPDEIRALRVRAFCGGSVGDDSGDAVGARLYGRTDAPDSDTQAEWVLLGQNEGPPTGAEPAEAIIDVRIESSTVAASFRGFECRARRTGDGGPATVGLDYLEVRLKY
jgi:hypothetical protein